MLGSAYSGAPLLSPVIVKSFVEATIVIRCGGGVWFSATGVLISICRMTAFVVTPLTTDSRLPGAEAAEDPAGGDPHVVPRHDVLVVGEGRQRLEDRPRVPKHAAVAVDGVALFGDVDHRGRSDVDVLQPGVLERDHSAADDVGRDACRQRVERPAVTSQGAREQERQIGNAAVDRLGLVGVVAVEDRPRDRVLGRPGNLDAKPWPAGVVGANRDVKLNRVRLLEPRPTARPRRGDRQPHVKRRVVRLFHQRLHRQETAAGGFVDLLWVPLVIDPGVERELGEHLDVFQERDVVAFVGIRDKEAVGQVRQTVPGRRDHAVGIDVPVLVPRSEDVVELLLLEPLQRCPPGIEWRGLKR